MWHHYRLPHNQPCDKLDQRSGTTIIIIVSKMWHHYRLPHIIKSPCDQLIKDVAPLSSSSPKVWHHYHQYCVKGLAPLSSLLWSKVWHHAEQEEASWKPPLIPEIESKQWIYRFLYHFNCFLVCHGNVTWMIRIMLSMMANMIRRILTLTSNT